MNGSLRPLAPIILTGAFFSGSGAVAETVGLGAVAVTAVPGLALMITPTGAPFAAALPAGDAPLTAGVLDNVPVATGILWPLAGPLLLVAPFKDGDGAGCRLPPAVVFAAVEPLLWALALAGVGGPACVFTPPGPTGIALVLGAVAALLLGIDCVEPLAVVPAVGFPAVGAAAVLPDGVAALFLAAELADVAPFALPGAADFAEIGVVPVLFVEAEEVPVAAVPLFAGDAAGFGDGLAVAFDELCAFCATAVTVIADARARILISFISVPFCLAP